ncbi:exported hypothetical protein [Candidatus Sulfopaludibacter sp. SbA4]|nr:exported hypothetical protein [Candidatus Sulfopaludibacter sp. SbA4]
MTRRSPLLWMALAFGLAVLAPGHPAKSAKAATRWSATPPVSCPLSLEAGQSARLVRASFGTQAPALRSTRFSRGWQRVAPCGGREGQFGISLFEFEPLYRRPPPSYS